MEGKFEFQFRTEVENKLNLGLEIEFGLNLKVSEVFFKKNCFGSPRYLTVVSGGSFFLGGNKDTRRCFLRCLQDSSNSSLLFNIVL